MLSLVLNAFVCNLYTILGAGAGCTMAHLGLRFLGLFALRRACLLIRVINNSILNFLISPDNGN